MLNNQQEADSTEVAPLERRSGERHLTVFRVAKLILGRHEQLCLIRNISANGLMVSMFVEQPLVGTAMFELRTGLRLTGRVAWQRGCNVGIHLHQPIDVAETLAADSVKPGSRLRAPRLAVEGRAIVMIAGTVHAATIHNLSQGGAAVECRVAMPIGSTVSIAIGANPPRRATVAWTREMRAGLVFATPLALKELAAVADALAQANRGGEEGVQHIADI